MAFVNEDNITDLAIKRWSTAHSPRVAELMTALVRTSTTTPAKWN